MARLPVDLMSTGVRENLPDAAFQPGQASGSAFGSDIGAGLRELGGAGTQLAAVVQANEKKSQGFEAEKRFLQVQEQDNTSYAQKQREISGSAAGFWQGARAETKKTFDDFLATLPEEQRAEYAVKAQRYLGARTAEAFSDQYKQQDANTRVTLTEEQRKAGLAVQQNPAGFDAFLQQQNELIDKSPLTPLEKTKLKAELKNSLAFTAAQSEAAQNPAAVISKGASERGSAIPVGDSYAVGVGGREALARVGAPPSEVLQKATQLAPATAGKTVFLSTGLINNPGDAASALRAAQVLKTAGANLVISGVADGAKAADGTTSDVLNAKLKDIAKQVGATFAPAGPVGKDGIHPEDYNTLRGGLGGKKYTTGDPAPASNASTADAVRWGAAQLGISPHDLATVISYETGGTFSSTIRGGAGNRHIGLIQFGAGEQEKYGANQSQTPAEQMQAVVGYLKDRGLKPGMSLLDLYSTINAGAPGRAGASDAGNGGAPGTVRDKVEQQMEGHKAKAAALLGGSYEPPPSRDATAARGNLTADQTRAVDEQARRTLTVQAQQKAAADEATRAAALDQTYLAIKEGPAPQAALEQARKSGVVSSYAEVVKAESILKERTKGDDDLETGLRLMAGGRGAANPFDKSHKDGIDAYYNAQSKASGDPAATAAAVFDKTGMVPPSYATSLRGALVSDDPTRLTAGLRVASNMLRQSPNALAGVEGRDQIEKAAAEYGRLTTGLGMDEGAAIQRIMQDARAPATDPVKSEVLQKFRKDNLSQEKIESRLTSNFGSIFSRPAMPDGAQRTAIASLYSEFAAEGFEQSRDPDKALAFADFKMKQQFGPQNGVLTRYPPSKVGLPALPGSGGDGYKWVNDQAAETVKNQIGIVVDPSQIVLMPIERDGVSTSAAFRNGTRSTVKRDDSRPGQQSSFESVPYSVMVLPKDEKGSIQILNGAFFPDVQSYVDRKNTEAAGAGPGLLYDDMGLPYNAPAHAPELMQTPEQTARRKQAEANARLMESQQRGRDVEAGLKEEWNTGLRRVTPPRKSRP